MEAGIVVKPGDSVKRGVKGRGGKKWLPSNTPLTKEQSELAAGWVPFAKKYARQCAENAPSLHVEFVSEFLFALLDAARNFDPDKNVNFLTYLKWHLRSARNAVIKRNKPRGYRASVRGLPEPKIVGFEPNYIPAGDGERCDHEAREVVRQKVEMLPEPFLTIVREFYFSGRTFVDLAEQWGKSPRMIRRLHKMALDVMRGDSPVSSLEGYEGVVPTSGNDFGVWLRKAREHRRMSQRQLGDLVDRTQGYISHIEQGVRRGSRDIQYKLMSVLGSGVGIED